MVSLFRIENSFDIENRYDIRRWLRVHDPHVGLEHDALRPPNCDPVRRFRDELSRTPDKLALLDIDLSPTGVLRRPGLRRLAECVLRRTLRLDADAAIEIWSLH